MDDDEEQKERMAVEELKRRMQGDMENELYEDENLFYKFLKARDFKVDNAEVMLRNNLEWRKKIDIKNILKYKVPEVVEKYFVLTPLGYDKEGRIVKYNHFANTDFRGILDSIKLEDFSKFLVHLFEKDILELKQQSKKLGKLVDKIVYIENLEHFSLAKATDKKVIFSLVSVINMYMDNYPEMLHTVHVINAPIYFHIFFSMMKPFLPNTIIQKVKIYSDDGWKKELPEVIEAEILPAFLGGTRTDPDGNPQCLKLLRMPENVQKSYYLSQTKKLFSKLPEVKKITISRSASEEMCLEAIEPDSYLEWEFLLKNGDIKFGIFHEDHDGNKSEIVPLQKINTDECSESGIYRCEKLGTYIVVFDNRYSFLKSKEIYCKIQELKKGPTQVQC